MSTPAPDEKSASPPPVTRATGHFSLRRPVVLWQKVLLGIACLGLVIALWWLATRGATDEDRFIGSTTLPSPEETFGAFHNLYFEFELSRNIVVTLRRVVLGFALALLVGVPLGIMAGCFPRFGAFLSPVVMFGRNIPLAAVLPLLIFIVPGGEDRKVAFIFIASVAFVISDTARAIGDVAQRYVDTAYTLGASRWQTIIKVLVPLAMPSVFGSARLLFGLAFGYIMLAESIKYADDVGGLGYQIQIFQRRGYREHIYLIILIIPIVALLVDQFLYWVQRSLFPYQYGGMGLLNQAVRGVLHGWDDVKRFTLGRFRSPQVVPLTAISQASDAPAANAPAASAPAASAPAAGAGAPPGKSPPPAEPPK